MLRYVTSLYKLQHFYLLFYNEARNTTKISAFEYMTHRSLSTVGPVLSRL